MLSRSLKNLTLASFLWTFIQNESVQSALTNSRYLPVWIFLFRRFSEKRLGSSHSMLSLKNPRTLLLAYLQKQPFFLQKDSVLNAGVMGMLPITVKRKITVTIVRRIVIWSLNAIVIPNKLNRRMSSLDKRIGLLSRHKWMMKLPLPLLLPLKWISPPIRFTIWIQLMHLMPQLFVNGYHWSAISYHSLYLFFFFLSYLVDWFWGF